MTVQAPVSPVPSERGDVPPLAVVTGGDSVLGRATAVALASDGFDVGITFLVDEESAQGAAAEMREQGRRAVVRQMDLGELPGAADAVDPTARPPAAPERAAKAGVGLLTKVLALELGEYGITVNAVAPGEVATEIAFLSSSGGADVTGTSHVVDGGVTLVGAEAGLSFPDDSWRRP